MLENQYKGKKQGGIISLFKLFLIFVKIGAVLLGGGYVILPIMQSEFAQKRELVSKDELVNYFALAQSLPGIVAANISMFVGYKLKGKSGALAAMFGIIFVPFWTIVLLASLIGAYTDNPCVYGILQGVGIAVIALILLTVREMWQNSKRDWFFYLIFFASLVLLMLLKLTPIQTILVMAGTGVIIKTILRRVKQ